MYVCMYVCSGPYSSVVRARAQEAEVLGSILTTSKLSGLEVSPLKVSGGSPVHLRSKHEELVGRPSGSKKKCMYVCMYTYIYIYTHTYMCIHIYIYIYREREREICITLYYSRAQVETSCKNFLPALMPLIKQLPVVLGYLSLSIYIYIYIQCVCIYIYIYIHTYIYIYIHIYVYIYTHMCVYIYIYVHISVVFGDDPASLVTRKDPTR